MKKLSDIIKERYHTPHKFSLITLEEFCENEDVMKKFVYNLRFPLFKLDDENVLRNILYNGMPQVMGNVLCNENPEQKEKDNDRSA